MAGGLARVRTFVVDADPDNRASLIENLKQSGFANIVGAENQSSLRYAAEKGKVDLIIIETAPGAKDAAPFLRALRHHELGAHPFPIAIATTATASSDHIRDLINAGFDDIVRHPLVFETLLKRTLAFVEARKKFVVTTDYIGPDRRASNRKQEGVHISLVDVPNPVRLIARQNFSHEDIQSLATHTYLMLNQQKIHRHVAQIQWLVDHILPNFLYESVDEECHKNIMSLVEVTVDLVRRIIDTDYAHAENVVVELVNVARRIAYDPHDANSADVSQLSNLSQSIERVFRIRKLTRY